MIEINNKYDEASQSDVVLILKDLKENNIKNKKTETIITNFKFLYTMVLKKSDEKPDVYIIVGFNYLWDYNYMWE